MVIKTKANTASSQGIYFNSGNGPTLQILDIEHEKYMAVISPDTAFWTLLPKKKIGDVLANGKLMNEYKKKAGEFAAEMHRLRFKLKPAAVYFNPTERCNLNCSYCYIPEQMRLQGQNMAVEDLLKALEILKKYFATVLSPALRPQIIFHSSEPLLNREAVFAGIKKYSNDFQFGIQTNGTLLDSSAIEFLIQHDVSIGLSLDGHLDSIADKARCDWAGKGVFSSVLNALEAVKGYANLNIICTITDQNMTALTEIVDFFHHHQVEVCMLNPVRCTREGARKIKPSDTEISRHFFKALDRTFELYQKTGRKLIIANFANVLASIIAPTARRLMCDISPCGGGRCFFALGATGDIYPCSEFVGNQIFTGGNIFRDKIADVMKSKAFKMVTGRMVERIEPCRSCAIRHFCGSPCPAEAYEMHGGMNKTGAFCQLYEQQVRYALRLIADRKESAYLWDKWDEGAITAFNFR